MKKFNYYLLCFFLLLFSCIEIEEIEEVRSDACIDICVEDSLYDSSYNKRTYSDKNFEYLINYCKEKCERHKCYCIKYSSSRYKYVWQYEIEQYIKRYKGKIKQGY